MKLRDNSRTAPAGITTFGATGTISAQDIRVGPGGVRVDRVQPRQLPGCDRTTLKHLARIDPERKLEGSWRARKRTRDALPKRINDALAKGRELVKEAKGLNSRRGR